MLNLYDDESYCFFINYLFIDDDTACMGKLDIYHAGYFTAIYHWVCISLYHAPACHVSGAKGNTEKFLYFGYMDNHHRFLSYSACDADASIIWQD